MKILIVGEYSGFAKNLSEGFQDLGHECVSVAYGDGWKKIKVGVHGHSLERKNYNIGGVNLRGTWRIHGLLNFHKLLQVRRQYKNNFDAILIINYEFIRLDHEMWYPYFSVEDLRYMLNPAGKIYLSSCGDDYPTLLYYKKMRYSALTDTARSPYLRKRSLKIFGKLCREITGVIPTMFEYAEAYREISGNLGLTVFETIPLPLSLKEIASGNEVKDKIVIFHGVNRISKGTDLIAKAFDEIREKYPDRVELVMDGKMPLDVYLKLLQRTNIIVDQCWGYSYGMNAIYGIAMGKVVCSGNEPECGMEFKREDVPVVNILPDAGDIARKLESLICNPGEIEIIGGQSRAFAEDFHDAKRVAQKYILIFNR